MRRTIFALFVLLLSATGFAPMACAHAVLTGTAPADREVLAAPPESVVLRFNEPVTPIAVRVIDGSGRTLNSIHGIEAVNNDVNIALPADLPPGTYVVSYRVTSADSHPVAGSLLFAVGSPPQGWAASAGMETDAKAADWAPLVAINRFLLLAAILVMVGGSLFLVTAARGFENARRRLRPAIGCAAAVVMATAVLAIGLQGGLLSGAPFAAFADADTWALGLSATRSQQSLALLVASGLIVGSLGARRTAWTAGLIIAGALTATGSFVLSGHMATATPRWAMVPALFFHVTVAAFWIGSLLPLLILAGRGQGEATILLRRFSAIAVVAVPLLIAAGIFMASAWIATPGALAASPYGRLLTIKAGLVAVLLGLAAVNRFHLMRQLGRRPAEVLARLRRTIAAEIVVGMAVVVATVLLSQTPHDAMGHGAEHQHGEAEPGSRAAGYTVVVPGGGQLAILRVAATGAGSHLISVDVAGEAGEPAAEATEATLYLANPALGIEAAERRMANEGPGSFRYRGPEMALAGSWSIRVEVMIGTFEKAVFATTVRVP